MIFQEIIEEQQPKIEKAVTELFEKAKNNQVHPQDMLLVLNNGFYKKFGEKNFVIGPDEIGFAEQTQYKFYDWYRKSHMVNYSEFNKKKETDKELKYNEEMSINLEKSLYLKFWESDMIIKRMKQLVNLLKNKSYDWFYEVPSHGREGSKQKVIRKEIRDEVKKLCPDLYDILEFTYKTQIRNAIAHSQYYITDNNICYVNYSANPKAHCPISSLSFKKWAYYIHNTILLYNELLKNFSKERDEYFKKTKKQGYIEVRVTKKDSSEEIRKLGIRNEENKKWAWLENLN